MNCPLLKDLRSTLVMAVLSEVVLPQRPEIRENGFLLSSPDGHFYVCTNAFSFTPVLMDPQKHIHTQIHIMSEKLIYPPMTFFVRSKA